MAAPRRLTRASASSMAAESSDTGQDTHTAVPAADHPEQSMAAPRRSTRASASSTAAGSSDTGQDTQSAVPAKTTIARKPSTRTGGSSTRARGSSTRARGSSTRTRKPPGRTNQSSSKNTNPPRPTSADGDDDYEDRDDLNDDYEDPNDHNGAEISRRRRNNKRKSGRSNITAARPTKRVQFLDLLSQKGQQGLPAIQLNAIDIPLTPQFVNTNRFLKAIEHGLREDPTAPQVYNPSAGEMSLVWDAEPREDRDFVPVEDKLELYTIHRNNEPVEVWRLVVRDIKRPEEDDIQVLRLPAFRRGKATKTNTRECSFLDLELCPTRDDALRLVHAMCEVLNKFPGSLPAYSQFYATNATGLIRPIKFIEIASLTRYNPLWENSVSRDVFDDWLQTGNGYLPNPQLRREVARIYLAQARCRHTYITDLKEGKLGETPPPTLIAPARVNVDLINRDLKEEVLTYLAPRDLPDGWSVIHSEAADLAAVKLTNHINRELRGRYGTVRQFKEFVSDIENHYGREPELNLDTEDVRQESGSSMVTYGSFNNAPAFPAAARAHDKYEFITSTVHCDILRLGTAKLSYKEWRKLLNTRTMSANTIHHAHIRQQAINAVAGGQGYLNALQAANLATDLVDNNLITLDEIKAQHCVCQPGQRGSTEHVCMASGHIRLCSEMVKDDQQRILCKACATKSVISDLRSRNMASHISNLVGANYASDAKFYDIESVFSKDELLSALMRQAISNDVYHDAFDGDVSFEQATYADICLRSSTGRGLTHPSQLSIDKLAPLSFKNGVPTLHHPDRVVLTRLIKNYLRGSDPVAFNAWVSTLLKAQAKVVHLPPAVEYHEEIRDELEAWDIAADNLYMIGKQLPVKNRTRLIWGKNKRLQAVYRVKILPQHKSGIWNGCSPAHGPRVNVFETRAVHSRRFKDGPTNLGGRSERKDLSKLTDEQKADVLEFFRKTEASAFYNPHKLVMPKNKDNSPWFWLLHHRPDDADFDMVLEEMECRLHTTDEVCDRKGNTDETIATFTCEAIVQWYETGGKCHMFGFKMTLYTGHPSAYSFGRGRAIYRRTTDNRREKVRDIVAGENLKTGCTKAIPKDPETDYNLERRSIIIESWKANSARSNWPTDDGTWKVMIEALLTTSESTHYYERRKPKEEYTPVPFPRSKLNNVIAFEQMIVGEGEDLEISDDEGDDPELEAVLLKRAALQQGSGGSASGTGGSAGPDNDSQAPSRDNWTADDFQRWRMAYQNLFASGKKKFVFPMLQLFSFYDKQARKLGKLPHQLSIHDLSMRDMTAMGLSEGYMSNAWMEDGLLSFCVEDVLRTLPADHNVGFIYPGINMLYFRVAELLSADDIAKNIQHDLDVVRAARVAGIPTEPFNGWPISGTSGTVRKAIIPYNSAMAHWYVVVLYFDEESQEGHIEVYNSLTSSRTGALSGSESRMSKFIRQFGELCALSPAVNLPNLTFPMDRQIVILPQTQQPNSVDCGVISLETIKCILENRDVDVRSGAGIRPWLQSLRYSYLGLAYQAVMQEHMPTLQDGAVDDSLSPEIADDDPRLRDPDNPLPNAGDEANANNRTGDSTNASAGAETDDQPDLAEAIRQEAEASMYKLVGLDNPFFDPRTMLGSTIGVDQNSLFFGTAMTQKFFDIVPWLAVPAQNGSFLRVDNKEPVGRWSDDGTIFDDRGNRIGHLGLQNR